MTVSRRRLIAISAAAILAPQCSYGAMPQLRRWTSTAMGAQVSLSVSGLTSGAFAGLVASVSAEIARLETIFSLYKTDSILAGLNRSGRIDHPPVDFIQLLSLAGTINHATLGAFDPTIQPLWQLYANTAGKPDEDQLSFVRNATGWRHLHFDSNRVSFARPGMALTLNGIAQGYVTDRVAALIRNMGLQNVLVSMGEIMAMGERMPGKPWRVGIAEKEDGTPEEAVDLQDRAIATSAPRGMLFGNGNAGHILNPLDGKPASNWRRIYVTNRSAAIADGLSTAFCVMDCPGIETSLQLFPGSSLVAVDAEARRITARS